MTKQSQFGLKITADLANNGQKLLDSEIAVNVDKDNNNLGLDISLFGEEDTDGNKKKYTINTAYLDGVIYAKYHNVKLSIPSSTISRMVSYAYDQVKDQLSDKINEVLDGGLDMGDIDINGIFADIKNTLKKINLSNGSFDIVLNIDHFNKYIDSENPILPSEDIVLTVNFDDHKITSISLSTINISTFSINLNVEFTDYQTITVDNPESYVDLDESEILIESVLEFINEKKYYLGIDIDTDDHDSSTNDLTFDGEIQLNFTGDNHYGYGEATIVDSNKYRHNLKADMYDQGNFIFSYNDKLKGSFTSQTIFDIADLVKEIIANPDEHFVELFGELLEKLNSTTLNRIIAGEYTLALDYEIISNLDINRSKTSFDLNLAIFGMDDITMHIEIGYTNDDVNYEYANLDYLSITNLNLLGKDVSVRLNFDKYQDTNSTKLNDSRRLNQFDTYLDFSCIKTLLALGVNTSKFNYYHFTGKLNATLPIIPDIKDLGLDAKIRNDHGDVTVMISLTNIPVLSLFGGKIDGYDSTDESARKAYIYYQHYEDKDKTDFWYIDRQDTVTNKGSKVDGYLWWATYNYTEYTHHTMRKCTNEYFLDNILDILIHDVLGINSSLLDKALNSESSSSTAIKYEDILSDFSYSENKHSFFFDIDLNALVGMNIFNKFELTVTEDPNENILDGVGVKLNLLLNLVKVDFTLNFEDDRYVDISNITIPEADNYIALHANDAYDQASTTEAVYSRSYDA